MESPLWDVLLVALLIGATAVSAAWCLAALLPERLRQWRQAGIRPRASAVLLLAALAAAAGLRTQLIPAHHAMYLDEPWYAEAACNLARDGRVELCEETWSGPRCTAFEKAWGWPVLMAPWVALTGCASTAGIPLSRGLGVATALLVALAARCAGGRWWQAAVAAGIAALHPVHVVWSNTGETNVAAAAALLLGVCGALIYLRAGQACGAALAIASFGLATAIRPELAAPALASGAVLALAGRDGAGSRLGVAAAIAAVCGAAALAGVQLWSMNESISGGAFLSLANLARAAERLAQPPALIVHGAIAALAAAGAIVLARGRGVGPAVLLLATAIAAALVVMAYDRFHERMLLAATVVLLPLTGFALGRDGWIAHLAGVAALAVLAWVWRPALLSPGVPSETQFLETRIATRVAEMPFEAQALFIAQHPTVLAASGLRPVMSVAEALRDPAQLRATLVAGRPVYFLRDMYCETRFEGGADAPSCERLLASVPAAPVAAETHFARTYTLYRLSP